MFTYPHSVIWICKLMLLIHRNVVIEWWFGCETLYTLYSLHCSHSCTPHAYAFFPPYYCCHSCCFNVMGITWPTVDILAKRDILFHRHINIDYGLNLWPLNFSTVVSTVNGGQFFPKYQKMFIFQTPLGMGIERSTKTHLRLIRMHFISWSATTTKKSLIRK